MNSKKGCLHSDLPRPRVSGIILGGVVVVVDALATVVYLFEEEGALFVRDLVHRFGRKRTETSLRA